MSQRDIPIIFSGPMVLGLLREANEEGTGKSMTRRLAWRFFDVNDNHTKEPTPWQRVKPGDRLWVRESFATPYRRTDSNPGVIYRADGPEYLSAASRQHNWGAGEKWSPSIHMPRWASRLTLVVTGTKIERLQSITEQDAEREGVVWEPGILPLVYVPGFDRITDVAIDEKHDRPIEVVCFSKLWNHLHGKGAWDQNPDVVVLTFRVSGTNIDALRAAA